MLENHKMGRGEQSSSWALLMQIWAKREEVTNRWRMKMTVIIQASKNKEWSQKVNWMFSVISYQDKFDKEWQIWQSDKRENDVVLQVFIRHVRWSSMRKNVKVFTEVDSQKHLRNFRTRILLVLVRLILIKHFETASVISFPPDPLLKYRQLTALKKNCFT